MPDYNSHGIEKFKVKIDDSPGARIDKYFDKVSDIIGKFKTFFQYLQPISWQNLIIKLFNFIFVFFWQRKNENMVKRFLCIV